EDEDGVAIPGAEIILVGVGTQSTNDSGITIFESLEPGTYPYEVLVEAYEAVNGTVELIDENNTELIVMDILVDLNETNQEAIQVYPNPVQDVLQIKGLSAERNTIKILDLQGKIVFETNQININSISVNHLNSGKYLLIVESNNTNQRLKFIKK